MCNTYKNSNPREPRISHPIPGRPWSKFGRHLFHFNNTDYLLTVEYYSKFPEISKLSDTTALSVIVAMKSMFTRHGPQCTSTEFSDFAKVCEFEHVTSRPGHTSSPNHTKPVKESSKVTLTLPCWNTATHHG